MEAKQTSLIDLLERIPQGARLIVEHDQFSSSSHPVGRLCHEAAAALRAALAQEQPEPSGYCTLEQLVVMQRTVPSPDKIAIYTAPPQRPPLTDAEMLDIIDDAMEGGSLLDLVRAVEKKVRGE